VTEDLHGEQSARNPMDAGAWYVLGRSAKEGGDREGAIACYRRGLLTDPANPAILTSLGTAFYELKRPEQAKRAYEEALAAHPQHEGARASLDVLLRSTGTTGESLANLRARAEALHRSGRNAEALEAYRCALASAPHLPQLHLAVGVLTHMSGNQPDSLAYFEEAVRLDPTLISAIEPARRIAVSAGLKEKAARYTRLMQSLRPSDSLAMTLALTITAIPPSAAAIAKIRKEYEQGLDRALAADPSVREIDPAHGQSAFLLAYHGENDARLQRKLAALSERMIPELTRTAPHCVAPTRRSGRMRVGFISRFLCDHSIGKTTRGLVAELSRELFEVYALRITPSKSDAVTELIGRSADHMITLSPDFRQARAEIAKLELDVLFFQDIGMEQVSYLLAFSRLALVQCVSFGHPNTTGIPNLDYFISNDLYEPEGAQAHYTEKLFCLHELPTLSYYYRPELPEGAVDRTTFGLCDRDHVYICPQTLFKVQPAFDAIVGGILRRDPDGVVVFLRGQYDDYTNGLRHRFRRSLPDVMDRILFLDQMRYSRFLQLLSVADVALDTLHFNGMNSSLEAFAVGLPVVTLPGGLQRGRHTQAMYRMMQITECIARDATDYVEVAVRLAEDRDHARRIRERIRDRSHVLYEDPQVVREFERFFIHALREARPQFAWLVDG
jgi:protein O-GlcNAc transferase